MSILGKWFNKKPSSADVAKERLKIVVSHERSQRGNPDFLAILQDELIRVIAKYVEIDRKQVKVEFGSIGDKSVLELNVTLPDFVGNKPKKTSHKLFEEEAEELS